MRLATLTIVVALASVPAAEARTLTWSSQTWFVRNNTVLQGPGPKLLLGLHEAVWVDSSGYLHMTIRKQRGRRQSSEVFTRQRLGFGRYTWVAEVSASLDANATLGMFTYQDDSHEYDVELAKWGNASDPANAQYAVQPAGKPGNLIRFASPAGPQTFSYDWRSSSVTFGGGWNYAGTDFWTGSAPVHINFWQFQGRPPANRRDLEIVIRSFSYVP
jgi:hypothetical protein